MLQNWLNKEWISIPGRDIESYSVDVVPVSNKYVYSPGERPQSHSQNRWSHNFHSKSKKVNTFDNAFINKMKEYAYNLEMVIDTLEDKQIILSEFKLDFAKYLKQYWGLIPDNDEKNNLVSLLENCIKNLHVEDIQKPQIDVLVNALDVLGKDTILEEDTERFFHDIVNRGIYRIGTLPNILE
ncbi:MAG: hypothetical protein MIO93_15225 [ANME-2 cluster archaeon]|nr:hypothetical protein [ANME-2 cluster archaeon]